MKAAERKTKQRAKPQANMTEEEKRNYKEKEKRRSQSRKLRIARMSKEDRSHFRAKEVARVTAGRKGTKQAKPDPPLQVKIPAKNPYKSR